MSALVVLAQVVLLLFDLCLVLGCFLDPITTIRVVAALAILIATYIVTGTAVAAFYSWRKGRAHHVRS
jgi:hypothetical protein